MEESTQNELEYNFESNIKISCNGATPLLWAFVHSEQLINWNALKSQWSCLHKNDRPITDFKSEMV